MKAIFFFMGFGEKFSANTACFVGNNFLIMNIFIVRMILMMIIQSENAAKCAIFEVVILKMILKMNNVNEKSHGCKSV